MGWFHSSSSSNFGPQTYISSIFISAGVMFYEENKTNIGFEELITLCLDVTSCAFNNPTIFQNLSSQKSSKKLDISAVFCALDIYSIQVQPFGTNMFSHGSHSIEPKCWKFDELFESGEETPSIIAAIRLNDMFSELVRMYQLNGGFEDSDTRYSRMTKLPQYWFKSFRDIVIGLSRTPLFTTYMRIPTEIWKMGWRVEEKSCISSEEMIVFPYNIPGNILPKKNYNNKLPIFHTLGVHHCMVDMCKKHKLFNKIYIIQ